MRRRQLISVLIAAVAAGAGAIAGPAGAAVARPGATTTQYSWHGDCPCLGHIVENGTHVTNTRFPGTDNGNGDAIGGRDNFTGSVSEPPSEELVLSGATDGEWCSDYDGQCTDDWKWTIEPNGTMFGWAIYPAGG